MDFSTIFGPPPKSRIRPLNLGLITLPNKLWAMHADPQLTFTAFLHMSPPNTGTITVDKALVFHFKDDDVVPKVYINGHPRDELISFQMETLAEVDKFLCMFEDLNLSDCHPPGKHLDCLRGFKRQDNHLPCSTLETGPNELGATKDEMYNRDYKSMGDVKGIKLPCNICSKETLNTHFTKHDEDEANHKVGHYSMHSKEAHADSEAKAFLCNICGKGFNWRVHLDEHMQTHNTKKRLECNMSSKELKSQNLEIHHCAGDTLCANICTFCGKTCTSPSNLAFHLKHIHRATKPYKCNSCNMRFDHRRNLNMHMCKHTGDKPSTICRNSLPKKINPTIHKRMYTGNDVHICKKCGKRISTVGNLASHLKKHGKG